jgi:hypothetical protein
MDDNAFDLFAGPLPAAISDQKLKLENLRILLAALGRWKRALQN